MSTQELNLKHIHNGTTRIVYNASFDDTVRMSRLSDFDHMMSLDEGEVVKHAVAQRKTVRFGLRTTGGSLEGYLKRHFPLTSAKGLFLKCCVPKTAFDEFENIIAFARAGLPTMTPLAAGIRPRGLFSNESYLVTKALAGCRRLDHLLAQSPGLTAHKKRTAITRLARLVKKMHDRGFNHRDLYLCHILLNSRGDFFFVDLHRVDQRARVPERWKVKDISALNYSAPTSVITRTDRLRFLMTYLGVERIGVREKRFVFKVMRKTAQMLQHNQKKRRGADIVRTND